MTLATDLCDDYKYVDGTEDVTVLDVSANTSDTSVTALSGNRIVLENGGSSGNEPVNMEWVLYAATMSSAPVPGDKITDASGDVWVIHNVETIQILKVDYKYICTTTSQ